MLGFLHLSAAQCAARSQQHDDARAHLAEAAAIAARIGERNGLRMHFGPTNIAVWRLEGLDGTAVMIESTVWL
jgi:hypothetical protein